MNNTAQMKVTGFTIVRNALKYDYPIVEAIQSILPLCDELLVGVGQSDDNTLSLIQSIASDKIRIIESTWDDTIREGGAVLAEETNKILQHISSNTDWAIYIQADEVLHEADHETIKKALLENVHDYSVDGLLFKYKHFFGSYDYVGTDQEWYPYEIRIIKNTKKIYSYRDAQGFRKKDNEKLRVKKIDAHIYHYGWVKKPVTMVEKVNDFQKLWHNDSEVNNRKREAESFIAESQQRILLPFQGTHPVVMQERMKKKNWDFKYDSPNKTLPFKVRLKSWIKDALGLYFAYRNYILIKE
jgi:hypothetical protein